MLLMFPLRKEQICIPRVNGTPVVVLLVQVQHFKHLTLELMLGGVDSLILAPELGQLLEGLPFKEALDVDRIVRCRRPFIPKHSLIFHYNFKYNKQGRAKHHGKGAWTTTRDRAKVSVVIFNFTLIIRFIYSCILSRRSLALLFFLLLLHLPEQLVLFV